MIPQAVDYSRKAFDYAYGDNKIRSAEVYMKSLVLQGSLKEAKDFGKKFMDQLKVPSEELKVRTGRYIDKFKKTWDSIKL
jgi:hypothetical protein